MMADGYVVGDGSWVLRVFVTDLQVERTLRVKGDMHVGGVMLKLVEDLDIANDWSDHALWWPDRNRWLLRTRSTLDQYGVGADANLNFTPMHKSMRIQLPDLRYIDCRIDCSVKCFNAVCHLCRDLGIRHPEEMSFAKPLEVDHLKSNYQAQTIRRKPTPSNTNGADTNTFIGNNSYNNSNGHNNSTNSLDKSGSAPGTPAMTPTRPTAVLNTSTGTWKSASGYSPYGTMNGSLTTPRTPVSPNSTFSNFDGQDMSWLAQSPQPSPETRGKMVRPKNLIERARMNVAWLDSSLSIMEQGVREYDTLLLRFKFYSFYDLNPKYDAVRINQVFEQAKWQIMNEEIDCTEEEMLMFAALQLQVNLQANLPQPDPNTSQGEDDIDAALTDLQISLEGSHIQNGTNITKVPELGDYLRFLKPKKFTLKGFKRYWFTCKDTYLYMNKSREEVGHRQPVSINLRGCEVTPDVNIAQGKYGIKLEVPSAEGMTEMYLRCDSEEQYARWMAACRLGAKGKTMADSSYEPEVKSILDFLALQRPAAAPSINPQSLDISAEDYVAPRFLRKLKGKLTTRILEAHSNVKELNLVEAKMNYIRAWQSLPEYGVSLFVVRFTGNKREELLGVAFNRLMRMDLATGDHIKTWRFNKMKAWNVNWEVKHMMVQFEDESIIFSCLSADCKVIHEFIGGYIFLSMRSKDANQTLNEELFHKLTGGWV